MSGTVPEERALELPGGNVVSVLHDRVAEVRDLGGVTAYRCSWESGELERAEVTLPDRSVLLIEPRAAEHPILGLCDAIRRPNGEHVALCSRVQWAKPESLPAVDVPGSLPLGAGTAILNLLSVCARHAGVETLRYCGPYPTGRLFDALLECFAIECEITEAFDRFTARIDQTILTGEVHEPDVAFVPNPFSRRWLVNDVCVQSRGTPEKVFVAGAPYATLGDGDRRLTPDGDGCVASVYVAGEPWAEILRLSHDGAVVDGPHKAPAPNNEYAGKKLPATVRSLLLQTVQSRAPDLLAPATEQVCAQLEFVWGDPGPCAAAIEHGRIVLHAAFPERMSTLTFNEALSHLIPAVQPLIFQLAQARLSEVVPDAS